MFCKALSDLYPKTFTTRRRWLVDPMNQIENQTIISILNKYGFEKTTGSFSTCWLNLEPSEDNLYLNLKAKWRNSLRKANRLAEQNNVTFISSDSLTNEGLDQFCEGFELHRKNKNYSGISSRFVKAELKEAQLSKQALVVLAFHQYRVIAGQYFLIQADSCSYRFGWNISQGKQYMCHYSMIWKSLIQLKRMGIKNFDLGGLVISESSGLSKFKLGLNGNRIESLGIFK